LDLSLDSNQLIADGSDMTRLAVRITDKFGNALPYVNKIISFEVQGPAELIGENPFPLFGGQAGLYIKARQEKGSVVIIAKSSSLPASQVTLTII